MIIKSIWRSASSDDFLGDNNEEEAKKTYDFYVDMILHFQKLFDYKGSIQDILSLPYCLFQDVIVAKIKLRQKEINNEETNKDKKDPMVRPSFKPSNIKH